MEPGREKTTQPRSASPMEGARGVGGEVKQGSRSQKRCHRRERSDPANSPPQRTEGGVGVRKDSKSSRGKSWRKKFSRIRDSKNIPSMGKTSRSRGCAYAGAYISIGNLPGGGGKKKRIDKEAGCMVKQRVDATRGKNLSC